ncbi:MAG TPA: NUDIX domain-containing protein [Gemmatimonas sp.]|nr:NUDIX domain-containing protein [Gemmatimonas sp.]
MHAERNPSGTKVRAGIVDLLVLAPTRTESLVRGTVEWRVLILRRGPGARCTGAWEIVHGRIEPAERPDDAAIRELREETGLIADRLYSITVNPFYLVATDSVELAIVFAALVAGQPQPTLGPEHDAWEWVAPEAAMSRLAWPRERDALTQALSLLATGDAGPVEDVLRVR